MDKRVKYKNILIKEFLYKEYITNKKSTLIIAKETNTNDKTIWDYLKMHNIKIRTLKEVNKGENHWNYIDGRTPLINTIRNISEYNEWRTQVFKRDGYKCQDCFKQGGNLEAHHIKPFAELLQEFLNEYNQFSPLEDKETLVRLAMNWKPFWDIDNGKTLCKKCHKKITFKTKGITC